MLTWSSISPSHFNVYHFTATHGWWEGTDFTDNILHFTSPARSLIYSSVQYDSQGRSFYSKLQLLAYSSHRDSPMEPAKPTGKKHLSLPSSRKYGYGHLHTGLCSYFHHLLHSEPVKKNISTYLARPKQIPVPSDYCSFNCPKTAWFSF